MDLGALRSLVIGLNFTTFGLTVSVNRHVVDEEPFETTGIWMTPTTEDQPVGGDFQRRDTRRVMAFRKTDVDSVPRGTVVMAPEVSGGEIKRWRADGIDRIEAEHLRVVLVPDFELY